MLSVTSRRRLCSFCAEPYVGREFAFASRVGGFPATICSDCIIEALVKWHRAGPDSLRDALVSKLDNRSVADD